MWRQYDFDLSEEAIRRLFGGKLTNPAVRACLARLTTDQGLDIPSAFFGYDDAGQPANVLCPIRIGASASSIRISAIGPEGCQMLDAAGPLIHAALIRKSRLLVNAHVRSGRHEIKFRPFPYRYYVPSMLVGKSGGNTFWKRAAAKVKNGSSWLEEADRAIPKAIANGLQRQIHYLLARDGDEDLVAEESDSIRDLKWLGEARYPALAEALQVRVHSVDSHTFAPLKQGLHTSCFHVVLRGVEFTLNAELMGLWSVGRSTSKNDGVIYASTRAWANDRRAA